MSHEFEIHHLVSQLVFLLNIRDTSDVDAYVEVLLKNRKPYVTTQVSAHNAKRKIAEFSPKGEEFLRKYDDLKLRQTRDLDPLVYLLSKISDDEKLCTFLRESRPPVTKPPPEVVTETEVLDVVDGQEVKLPPKGAVLTKEELGELMGKLESVTTTLQEKEKEKHKQKAVGQFPKLPAWLTERPYLTADFVRSPSLSTPVSLGSLPLQMQQQAVIEDLLYLMMGIDGRYIRSEPLSESHSIRQFAVDRTLDVSLQALVNRILPICSQYSVVSRFIVEKSKFVHGMVNQALCAAMGGLVKEYLVIVAQLEHQFRQDQLTLQKLWYYVQPCMRTLEILSRVAVAINRGACRGGKTLTHLHNVTCGYIGDERAQELSLHLTQAACKPYFEILEKWIYTGVISDPYREFMIEEHEVIRKDRLHEEYNDAYWERRYTVLQENIPSFLEQVAEKVLCTGKYLNVIRECGKEVAYSEARGACYTLQERQYVELIEKAYSFASKKLLEMMIEEQDLMGYLRSIKHYFLLDQGDLLVHFMDMAQEELYKPMSDILPTRLESLLELALRTSLADCDPYKDNLRPILVPYDLITQLFYIMAIQPEGVGPGAIPPPPIMRPDPTEVNLSGLEAFSLDYTVKWPLSLVISRKCLFKYQMLFRHLFYCKHVERQLCATWSIHKVAKRLSLHSHSWYVHLLIGSSYFVPSETTLAPPILGTKLPPPPTNFL